MPAEALPSFLWIESIPEVGHRLTLDAEAARYVARVCRVRAGERITVTDGGGRRAQALVVEADSQVVIEVATLEMVSRLGTATVLCGAPERGRADWLVEKLAELGVGVFQPIDCERARWMGSEVRLERWGRLAVAALRQSRRVHRLEVREPIPFAAALGIPAPAGARYLADPDGTPGSRCPPPEGEIVGLIGPAEGFSPDEVLAATSAGYVRISFSKGRLRSETAALAWGCWWSAIG